MLEFSIFINQLDIYHINTFLQYKYIVFIILLYYSNTRNPLAGIHLDVKVVITLSELSHLSQFNCVADLLNELCDIQIGIIFDDRDKKIGLEFCHFEFLVLSI